MIAVVCGLLTLFLGLYLLVEPTPPDAWQPIVHDASCLPTETDFDA